MSPLTSTYSMGPLKNTTKEKEREKEKEDEITMRKYYYISLLVSSSCLIIILQRWAACCKAMVTLMKSWTGIVSFIYFHLVELALNLSIFVSRLISKDLDL